MRARKWRRLSRAPMAPGQTQSPSFPSEAVGRRQAALYDVTFELRTGATVLDRVNSYFGFRSVTAESGHVLVTPSHVPEVRARPGLLAGEHPDATLRRRHPVRHPHDQGDGLQRRAQAPETRRPRFLYWADKMGFLVSSEMANAYLFDSGYVERFTREWMEAMARDTTMPHRHLGAHQRKLGVPDVRDARQQNHLKSSTRSHVRWMPRAWSSITRVGAHHMTDLFALHITRVPASSSMSAIRTWASRARAC